MNENGVEEERHGCAPRRVQINAAASLDSFSFSEYSQKLIQTLIIIQTYEHERVRSENRERGREKERGATHIESNRAASGSTRELLRRRTMRASARGKASRRRGRGTEASGMEACVRARDFANIVRAHSSYRAVRELSLPHHVGSRALDSTAQC